MMGIRKAMGYWRGLAMALGMGVGLTACVGGPVPRPNMAVFDLGMVAAGAPAVPWLGALDVTAPSWLDSRAMQYRLEAEPARRQVFSENRWAATPAELLASSLRRQLGAGGEGCRLRLELDEWVQVFDGAGHSRAYVAVRAGLYPARGDGAVARQGFQLDQAAGRDPRQGVAAFAELERQLATHLGEWLARQGREQKDLAARCRS